MKKIFKGNKLKVKAPSPSPAGDAEFASPGYSLKEKDLPKLHKAAWNGDLVKLQQLSKKGDVNQLDKENRLACNSNTIFLFYIGSFSIEKALLCNTILVSRSK